MRGPAQFVVFWHEFRKTFADIRISVDDTVEAGDMTYCRCTARMTHNGRPIVMSGGCQVRVRDGKIVDCWNQWDFTGLLIQMGSLPVDILARSFEGHQAHFA